MTPRRTQHAAPGFHGVTCRTVSLPNDSAGPIFHEQHLHSQLPVIRQHTARKSCHLSKLACKLAFLREAFSI
jgi:hypothetical protein